MGINTTPSFYYIDPITVNNLNLNFDEGSGELNATLDVGSYSHSQLPDIIAKAMNDVGTQEYECAFNRDTRKYTISASANFSLLPVTGSNAGLSVFSTIGFTLDVSGSNSYESDLATGTEYIPQFPLQGFRGFEDSLEFSQTAVSESATGVVEVVSFGPRRFMEFNITYINDSDRIKGGPIERNTNAVQEARDFMEFAITKRNIEFMKNKEVKSEFDITLLERTRTSRNGTAYRLQELYNRNLFGFYETGNLRFRKVTE